MRHWQGMKNPCPLPLICINVSLGQNILPQSVPSLSAHFLFTRNGLQSASGEIFWDLWNRDEAVPVWNTHQFRKQCLDHFYNPRGLVIGVRANCLFLCVPASSSEKSLCVCFSGLKGGFCKFHFILERALPWWGLCKRLLFLLQEFREAGCEGRVVFGISVALGALRKKKRDIFIVMTFI